MNIRASEKAIEILNLLNEWEKKEELYNLELQEFELYDEFEELEYLDEWFGFDYKSQYEDRFLAFANDGTGGELALWFYPDLTGEPPVIFTGSEGETNLIAGSLEDFVCLLTRGKLLNAGDTEEDRTPESLWYNIYKLQLEELAEDNEVTTEEAKTLLHKSAETFKQFIHNAVNCRDEIAIFKDNSKHPDFIKWVDSVVDRNT